MAVHKPAPSEAVAWSIKNSRCLFCQRSCTASSMPIDSITWAFLSEASANCWAPMAARLASIKGARVAFSLNHATLICAIAPTSAHQPSTGLIAKIKTSATKATGASITASKAGLNKNSRTVLRSFMACKLPPIWRFKNP